MDDLQANLKLLKDKVESVPESKYAVQIYVGTIFFVLVIPVIVFLNLCLFNILLALMTIAVPYFFYKERSIKKILIAGLIAILLVNVVGTVNHVNILFSEGPNVLESDHLQNGTVDQVYGDKNTDFNFTIDVHDMETTNYTVFLNLSYQSGDVTLEEKIDSYEMEELNGQYYKVLDLDERQYSHRFSLRVNESSNTTWYSTNETFGPFTISKRTSYTNIFVLRLTSPILLFGLFVSLMWWRSKLEESKRVSTEGLDEKEEELDDYCKKCGALLKGADECPNCGAEVKKKAKIDEALEDMEKAKRITCPNCRKMTYSDQESCPYCGEDL